MSVKKIKLLPERNTASWDFRLGHRRRTPIKEFWASLKIKSRENSTSILSVNVRQVANAKSLQKLQETSQSRHQAFPDAKKSLRFGIQARSLPLKSRDHNLMESVVHSSVHSTTNWRELEMEYTVLPFKLLMVQYHNKYILNNGHIIEWKNKLHVIKLLHLSVQFYFKICW